jgi:hypothetical protein
VPVAGLTARFRGNPVAPIVFYGSDDTTATKLTVGTAPAEYADISDFQCWFSDNTDIRNDATVAQEVLAFIDAAGARSVVMTDRIIGCCTNRVSTTRARVALLAHSGSGGAPPRERLRQSLRRGSNFGNDQAAMSESRE